MKRSIKATLVAVLLCAPEFTFAETPGIREAIKNGLIEVVIAGRSATEPGSGSHYGKCLQIKIRNLKNTAYQFEMECGRMLTSKDPDTQDMLITKKRTMAIGPHQSRSYALYAMCGQKSNHAPGSDQSFTIGEMAGQDLRGLARLIEEKDYQNSTAQSAVWVLTDDIPISSIRGNDPEMVACLQNYVAKATGRPIPKITPPVPQPTMTRVIKGEFNYRLPAPAKVSLLLYNSSGNVISEFFKDKYELAGLHRYSFEMTKQGIPKNEKYYFKLFVNGRMEKEKILTFE